MYNVRPPLSISRSSSAWAIALRCVPSAVGVNHVTGYMGSKVEISCSYDKGYESYEKYLCKNNCGSDDDVLIKTSESRKSKYRINDDKTARIVTATIFDLHSTDAGKYWCGVTRTGIDIYTEVKLELVPEALITVSPFCLWVFSLTSLFLRLNAPKTVQQLPNTVKTAKDVNTKHGLFNVHGYAVKC
uniref:Immunoglobulin V-set domain-containing protein n=1 Tax=Pundamilia nyererei TaxID=303518 RepID=A0A3B4F8Q2_9CICH